MSTRVPPVDPTKPRFAIDDVLNPDELRQAIGPLSDDKWEDVRARIPWSEALGKRTLVIRWGRFLSWMEQHERKVA